MHNFLLYMHQKCLANIESGIFQHASIIFLQDKHVKMSQAEENNNIQCQDPPREPNFPTKTHRLMKSRIKLQTKTRQKEKYADQYFVLSVSLSFPISLKALIPTPFPNFSLKHHKTTPFEKEHETTGKQETDSTLHTKQPHLKRT